jgi:hypothetical protein
MNRGRQVQFTSLMLIRHYKAVHVFTYTKACLKFSEWPPGARTANGTAFCY